MGKPGYKERNPNWRGGRLVASNGYVLIRVGVNHPLADVRGYAYEHRIVAQEKLGRPLLKGEIIHHIDRNKQNNHPDNLLVLQSQKQHIQFHPPHNKQERMTVSCECGCGQPFTKRTGSKRRFVSGHNHRGQKRPRLPLETYDEVRSLVKDGMTQTAVAKLFGLASSTISRIVNGRR